MSFFKKKENEFSTGKKKPKLKPVGGDAKEKAGASGKGGGQPAEPKYDVNAKGWNDQVAKFNAKGGINNDGRFGYGYIDTETGIEVPWYIDMINGGGANAAGDTFVSPFEDAPMGGGMMGIGSQAISGGLNAMGVAPYGSNRPRYFMPMEAARVDAEGKPVQVNLGPAPTGSGSPMVTPDPAPAPDYRFMYSDEVGRGVAPDNYGIGTGGEYAGTVPAQLVGAPTGPSVGNFNTLAATVPDYVLPTARQRYLDFILSGGKMPYSNWILSQ
jgi:hypothetical protein